MEQVHMDEIEKFQSRVGITFEKRLQWALDFAQRDLNNLSRGDWDNLRMEMGAFAMHVPTQGVEGEQTVRRLVQKIPKREVSEEISKARQRAQEDIRKGRIHRPRQPYGSQTFGMVPTEQEIRQAQVELRRIVEHLVSRGTAQIGPVHVSYTVSRRDKTQISPPGPRVAVLSIFPEDRGDFSKGILPVLAYYMGAYGAIIEVCPECKRFFLTGRTNQTYCGTQCQWRVNQRKGRGIRIFQEGVGRPPTDDEAQRIAHLLAHQVREFAESIRQQQPPPQRKKSGAKKRKRGR